MSQSSTTPASVSTARNLRKGTRSCFECRLRKIRCVFRPNNPSTCISCFSHGIRCVSQAESESTPPSHAKMNLSERVAQLEQELASMRAKGELTPNNNGLPTNATKQINEPALPTVSMRTSSLELSFPISALPSSAESLPVLSLFDNTILASDARTNLNDSIYREFSTGSLRPAGFESIPHFRTSRMKRAKVCEALTDLLPSHSAMYEVLEAGGLWWDIVRKMHPYMCSEDTKMTIQSYVFWALNQDNPAVIGCALSWMALSLQCLPHGFESNHLGLPLPVHDLTHHYVSNVNRLIVSDDELSVSLEGIECILLQSHFYGNVGRPRKGWTTARRGLSYATLLGLHRLSSQASSALSVHAKRRENAWWYLVESDAQLSLLLGLPSFMVSSSWDSENQIIASTSTNSNGYYERRHAVLINTISQRNQATPASLASLLSTTSQIDQRLEGLASHLLPILLPPVTPSDHSKIDAVELYERVIKHFRHYKAKTYLHLPFMLQASMDNQFDYNRTQCLIASREIVELYIRIRQLAGGIINFCQMVDFQAFMAAVILILGLLGYGPTSARHDTSQEAKHWNLIHETMEVLRKVMSEPENMLAAQCLQVLERLQLIAHGQFQGAENSSRCKIFIPYFGMIYITPGSSYPTLNTILPQHPTQCNTTLIEETVLPPVTGAQVQNAVIEIDIFNAPFLRNLDSTSQSAEPNDISFHDTLAMDIDQDWTWMLNHNYQTS